MILPALTLPKKRRYYLVVAAGSTEFKSQIHHLLE